MLAVAAFGVGCASPSSAPKIDAVVRVTVRNFGIDVPSQVRAGLVQFDLAGAGPTMHEFNIVRTHLAPSKLPLKPDGTVDDLSPHPDFEHLAEREGIDTGDHATLTVRLIPGDYVVYCNMDGHYMAGMSAGFSVR